MNKEDSKSFGKLKHDVEKYKIFIDTCSLLQGNITQILFNNIIPVLKEKQAKIFMPKKCLLEVEKISQSNSEASKNAKDILPIIKQYVNEGYIDIKYDKSEGDGTFADNTFISVFTMYRDRYDLLLITQDNNLAKDILNLNNSKAVRGTKNIAVRRINKYGFLSLFDWQFETFKPSTGATKITDTPDTPIEITYSPQEGDTVLTDYGPIKLTQTLGVGGEGIAYETNTPYVAKIYKSDKLTQRKYEKIVKIIEKGLKYEGICFPTALLYSDKHEFIGYLMPRAKGEELGRSVFIKPLFTKKFPTWHKEDLVQLCITILDKIKYLHEHNVIMGDVNGQNILIVSPNEVYFVDTDSYQIENYPCPVGLPLFTAPEVQGKKYSDFLRSIGNENFAIATLMFMIMLPGKQPYAQQGGEDQVTNIMKMDFPYPCGEKSNKKTPEGAWGYIWSHLPRKMKEAFYSTFMSGESHSTEQTRLSADNWLELFHSYYYELTDPNGNMLKNDAMSNELFPTRHKKRLDRHYIVCKLCRQEVDSEFSEQGICRTCLGLSVGRCSKCGKELSYTNFHKYIKGIHIPSLCKDCYDSSRITCNLCGKTVDIDQSEAGICNWCLNTYNFYPCNKCGKKIVKITNRERYINKVSLSQTCEKCKPYTQISCASCGTRFTITVGEKEFYDSKGFELPKKCKKCKEEGKSNNTKRADSSWNTKNTFSNYNSRLQQEKENAKNEVITLCNRAKYMLNFLQISKKNNIISFCSRITKKIDLCSNIKEVRECVSEAQRYINNQEYSWH